MLENNKPWKDKMSQLKGHASQIDLPLEWDALESRMEKRKRRKVIFWLWPLIFALAIGSMYFYSSDESDQKNLKKDQAEHQTIATDKQNGITHENGDQLNKSNVNRDQLQTFQVKKEERSIYKREESRSEHILFKSKIISKSHQHLSNNTYTNTEVEASAERDATIKKDKLWMGTHQSDFLQADAEENVLSENIIPHTRLEAVKQLTSIHGDVESRDRILPDLMNGIVPQNKPLPFFTDIRMMAGRPVYDYVNVSLDNESLLSDRKIQERPLEFIGGRWTLGKEVGHQWYVSLGMAYARINDRWKSKQLDTLDIILNDQVIETYTNQDGVVTQKKGTKQSRQIVELTQTRYNASEYLAGTISLGRYFYLNKIRWAIEGNLSLPVYSRFYGEVLDIDGQMTAQGNIYQPFKTLQYGIHTSCLYPVSGNLVLYGGYDYNFSRLSSDLGYFRKQHIHSLSIGLKYYINH